MKKWIAFLLIFVLTAQLVPMAFASGRGFDDVVAGSWYEAAVNWAVNHSITNGMGDNKFMPDATCTRAQIVTFLYRDLA